MKRLLAVSLISVLALGIVSADGGVNYPSGSSSSKNSRAAALRAGAKRTGAEVSLLGISLYDSGALVVKRFGSPDEIQAINIGTASDGGGGAGGRGGAGGGGGGGNGGANSQRAMERTGPDDGSDFIGDPFNQGSEVRQSAAPEDEARGGGGGGSGQRRFGPGGDSGSDAGGGGAEGEESTQFTRWVYRNKGSRYGFILDKYNKVIQIEAIGLQDSRVRTRRGVEFGDTFQTLIQQYGDPDGYEISGDNIIVRFMTKARVAFRITRLKANGKHQVTGVVVAAGKK